MSKVSCELVREKYPFPVSGGDPMGTYCVGGALCGTLGTLYPEASHATGQRLELSNFPSYDMLAEALAWANPELAWEDSFEEDHHVPGTAQAFAETLIDHNDKSEFEEAWQVLCDALDYKGAS